MATAAAPEEEPPASGLDFWHDVLWDMACPADMHVDSPEDFSGTIVYRPFDVAKLGEFTATPIVVERTPSLIRRSDPELFVLSMHTRGGSVLAQGGREVALRPGDVALHDTSRPYRIAGGHHRTARPPNPGVPQQLLLLMFPHALLPPAAAGLTAVRLADATSTGGLVAATFGQLHRCAVAGDDTSAARLSSVVLDLLSIGLDGDAEQTRARAPETRERTLGPRITAFIGENLGDPRLCPAMIAAAHHISVRYLHKIFERRDTTVAEHIRTRRLEECRRDLVDPTLRHRPVGAVAARWGFRNAAHFNRLFRTAYGVPPASYRRLHVS